MVYKIQNNSMSVSVSSLGAELQSIKAADGTEYLWQGDSTYWADRSPVLFPYIGRMINKQYSYNDHVYPMDIHGFALSTEFKLIRQTDTMLVFSMASDEDTKAQYPWEFSFTVTYTISGCRLDVIFTVENKDTTDMLFAVGGHPGFNVPLSDNLSFEDYRIRFPERCNPDQIIFSKECFVQPFTKKYTLDSTGSIPLRHDLFNNDAIVLQSTPKKVILESEKDKHAVIVTFPDMNYIGFWHETYMEAPYVCIEPWSSLPSACGSETRWECQSDLLLLEPKKVYNNRWSIELKY